MYLSGCVLYVPKIVVDLLFLKGLFPGMCSTCSATPTKKRGVQLSRNACILACRYISLPCELTLYYINLRVLTGKV